jgi:hypothetical protein
MKKIVQGLAVLVGIGGLLFGAASPADAEPGAPDVVNGNETHEQTSCDLYKAREMCCPIWCGGKAKSIWNAATALKGCARSYACDWKDSPSEAGFQCDSACK